MAQRYARGSKAWGHCERCGIKSLLKELRYDGQLPDLQVCSNCYDPRHPQERLPETFDPVALYDPTMDLDSVTSADADTGEDQAAPDALQPLFNTGCDSGTGYVENASIATADTDTYYIDVDATLNNIDLTETVYVETGNGTGVFTQHEIDIAAMSGILNGVTRLHLFQKVSTAAVGARVYLSRTGSGTCNAPLSGTQDLFISAQGPDVGGTSPEMIYTPFTVGSINTTDPTSKPIFSTAFTGNFWDTVYDPENATWFACGYGSTASTPVIIRSTAGTGDTDEWEDITSSLPDPTGASYGYARCVDSYDGTVIVGRNNDTINVSQDSGDTWATVNLTGGAGNSYIFDISRDAVSGYWYVTARGSTEYPIWESKDNGVTWGKWGAGALLGAGGNSIKVFNGIGMAGTLLGLEKTVDGGNNWYVVKSEFTEFGDVETDGVTWQCQENFGSGDGASYSTNNGESWVDMYGWGGGSQWWAGLAVAEGTGWMSSYRQSSSVPLHLYSSDGRGLVNNSIVNSGQTMQSNLGSRIGSGAPLVTGLTVADASFASVTGLTDFDTGLVDSIAGVTWTASGSAAVSTTEKKFGTQSVRFPASADHIHDSNTIDWNFGTGDFTIEFFVFPEAFPTTTIIFDTRPAATAGDNITIYTDSSQQVLFFTQGSSRIVSGSSGHGGLGIDHWSHVALCRASGTTRLFIQGVVRGTPWADTVNYAGGNKITLGESSAFPGIGQGLQGYIDALRITKGVARYTSNFVPPSAKYATS